MRRPVEPRLAGWFRTSRADGVRQRDPGPGAGGVTAVGCYRAAPPILESPTTLGRERGQGHCRVEAAADDAEESLGRLDRRPSPKHC